jgi:hypothetical protein
MAGFLDWKYISEEQLQTLEHIYDEMELTRSMDSDADVF